MSRLLIVVAFVVVGCQPHITPKKTESPFQPVTVQPTPPQPTPVELSVKIEVDSSGRVTHVGKVEHVGNVPVEGTVTLKSASPDTTVIVEPQSPEKKPCPCCATTGSCRGICGKPGCNCRKTSAEQPVAATMPEVWLYGPPDGSGCGACDAALSAKSELFRIVKKTNRPPVIRSLDSSQNVGYPILYWDSGDGRWFTLIGWPGIASLQEQWLARRSAPAKTEQQQFSPQPLVTKPSFACGVR